MAREIRKVLFWPCGLAAVVYCITAWVFAGSYSASQAAAALTAIATLSLLMLSQPLEKLSKNHRNLLCITTALVTSLWFIATGVAVAAWTSNAAYRWLGILLAPLPWAFYLREPETKPKEPEGFSRLGTVEDFNDDIRGLWSNESVGLGNVVQLVCAGIQLPFETAREHNFLVVGDIGSGKTTILKEMMQSVLPHVGRTGNLRALVYDAKNKLMPFIDAVKPGDIPCYMLNPSFKHAFAWDIAADCRTPEDAEQASNAIVHSRAGGNSGEYFTAMSRLLAKHAMIALADDRGRDWDLLDVVFTILDPKWRDQIIPKCPEGRMLLDNLGSQETTDNIMSAVLSYFGKFIPLASQMRRHAAEGRTFSVMDWIRFPSVLVLGGKANADSSLSALNRMILERVRSVLLDGDSNPDDPENRSFLFLDEFADLGRSDAMTELMRRGRDFGVCSVLAFQNLSDLLAEYRDKDACNALLGHTTNRIYLRMKAETAEWASKQIGHRPLPPSVQVSTNSRTGDRNVSETHGEARTYDYVVHPSKLQNLPVTKGVGVQGYLNTALSSVVPEFFIPWDNVIGFPTTTNTDFYPLCPQEWQRIDPMWLETKLQSGDVSPLSDDASEQWFQSFLDSLKRFSQEDDDIGDSRLDDDDLEGDMPDDFDEN